MSEVHQMFLENLKKLGNGDCAALKRSVGTMLHDADAKALTAFYRCLPYGTSRKYEDRWFAVACLYSFWGTEVEGGKPLEQVIAKLLKDKELSDSIGHRIEVLLDTDWDDDGYLLTKLTRILKLIRQKSNHTSIDFDLLLQDLIWWNAENQSVQRKWARSIFGNFSETETEVDV